MCVMIGHGASVIAHVVKSVKKAKLAATRKRPATLWRKPAQRRPQHLQQKPLQRPQQSKQRSPPLTQKLLRSPALLKSPLPQQKKLLRQKLPLRKLQWKKPLPSE
jgi:hypothetical protein